MNAWVALLALASVVDGKAEPPRRYVGRLEPRLQPSGVQQLVLETADPRLPDGGPSCGGTVRCFEGMLQLGRRTYLREGGTVKVVLVEESGTPRFLLADLNRDGTLESGEGAAFEAAAAPAAPVDVVLRFPAEQAPGGRFAYLLRSTPSDGGSRRVLEATDQTVIRGTVEVDGRPVAVVLPFDLAADTVEFRNGYIGMDCDGDGLIDTRPLSPEYAFARDEDVVFRVGNHFVSVLSADRRLGRLVLQERPARDYERLELGLGARIPDLEFRELSGIRRRLYRRGDRYTLLFFWGLGCGAWPSDLPTINEALRRFGSHGFSVVAISDAEDDQSIGRRIRETGARWTQVAASDGRRLYWQRFRIWQSPTLVLVDREGRVVSRNLAGELPLRDEDLLRTLERLVGARE